MKWQKRLHDKNKEAELLKLGYKPILARLFSQRDIPVNDVEKFIKSDYNDLSHPHNLKGVKEASELFCKVAMNKGRVGCIGDFDADGIVSATMIKELCNIFKLECKIFLPSRTEHGYGLNHRALASFKKMYKDPPDLLIITDCGSNNENEIQELKSWGIKQVIILDHHIVDPLKISKSADVLINWHLCNFGDTCACGEVFHFIRGIRWLTKKVNPIEFLSLASVGILADVSPITGDNRIIVKHGLGEYALNNVTSSGLNALVRHSGVKEGSLSQEDVLFKIAPRINAVGRLSKPDMAYKLLIEQNPELADLMAKDLNEHNVERKKIQRKIEKEAVNQVEANIEKFPNAIAIYNPEWPIGVVGLVASKLVEKFCKPAIVMGKNGDIIKGSGRSLENINLKEILDGCKHLFDGYGGHALAAGVTVKINALNDVNDILNKTCEDYYKTHNKPQQVKYYDAEIKPKFVNLEIAQKLRNSLHPYCNQNNPEPIFKLSDVTLVEPELYERNEWKILSFYASKDGIKTDLKMKLFSDDLGTEIAGMKADIYFSFPQSFIYPSINVIDLVLKK